MDAILTLLFNFVVFIILGLIIPKPILWLAIAIVILNWLL
jgi:hypothetical protein